jgi:LemA protein
MRTALVIVAILLLVAIVVIFVAIGDRNQLVQERLAIGKQWMDVDNALQRRGEIAGDLVQTVQQYAGSDQSAIKQVTDARAALAAARTPHDRIQANSQLDAALSRLLLSANRYPRLKSDEDFLRLEQDLQDAENHIAVERRKYNEAVQRYNTDIELFPKNIAAGMFGFERNAAYFTTETGPRTAPHLAF